MTVHAKHHCSLAIDTYVLMVILPLPYRKSVVESHQYYKLWTSASKTAEWDPRANPHHNSQSFEAMLLHARHHYPDIVVHVWITKVWAS